MFKFHCTHCQQRIAALEEEVGIVGTCPSCDHAFTIPAPPAPEPEPASEPEPVPEPEPHPVAATFSKKFDPTLEYETEPEAEASPSTDAPTDFTPAANPIETRAGIAEPAGPKTTSSEPATETDAAPISESAEPLALFPAILTGVGFNAALAFGLFSLWAEWGPYAWVTALQIHFFGQHLPAVTFILTILICGFPVLVLYHLAANGGRLASILAHGIVGLALTAHFAATVYFLITAASPPESTALASAAQGATFLPHPVSLTPDYVLLLDQQLLDGLAAPSTAKDPRLHIPFYPSQWANGTTPVILSITKSSLESQKTKPRNIVGTIRKRPLPYMVRRSVSTPLFCTILTEHESVRAPWIVSFILYAGLGIYALQRRLRSGRGSVVKAS